MAVTTPSDGETWALDLVGNWDKKATGTGDIDVAPTDDYAPPNPLHQYTGVTPAGGELKPFSHDFLGQLRKNGRRAQEYTWDYFGRLTKVCADSGETCSDIASYRYDALNRRVEKVVESGNPAWDKVTRFYYDGWRAVEERAIELEGTPQVEVEYVRARYGFGVGLDEVLWMDRDRTAAPDGALESRYFFAHDLLGNVVTATEDRAASTDALQVAERYTYSAYGEVSVWTAAWSQASGTYVGPAQGHSAIGMPYLYTGQRQDPETGLWYFKNRVYDGKSGRFLRRDPIGLSGGANLYRYAMSAPGLFTDPMGLDIYYGGGIGGWGQWQERDPWRRVGEGKWGVVPIPVFDGDRDIKFKWTPEFPWDDGPVDDGSVQGLSKDTVEFLKQEAKEQRKAFWGKVGQFFSKVGRAISSGAESVLHSGPDNPSYGADQTIALPDQSRYLSFPDHSIQRPGDWTDSTRSLWLDRLQLGLDIGGLVPGLGEPLDILSGLISLGRGDYIGASASFGSAVPIVGNAVGAAKILRRARKLEALAARGVARNPNVYEVLSEQAISGTTRSAHRAAANRGLVNQLEGNPQLRSAFDDLLGGDVVQHMRSGSGALRNPPGTVWHHPANNSGAVQLLRAAEHTNPALQPVLHPNGIGGFGNFYGGP